ncbi:hypothetical protein Dimus_010531, partial [Dionaea muscipula]
HIQLAHDIPNLLVVPDSTEPTSTELTFPIDSINSGSGSPSHVQLPESPTPPAPIESDDEESAPPVANTITSSSPIASNRPQRQR